MRSLEATAARLGGVPEHWGYWGGAICAAAGWAAACAWVAPRLPLVPLAAYGFGFACVSISSLAAAATIPSTAGRAPWVVLPSAAGLLAIYVAGGTGLLAVLVVMVCLLIGGTALGAFVGARIEHPGHLLFVVPASAVADIVSLHHPEGVSAAILASEAALSVLAVSFPMLGTHAIEPLLGVGDVVFIALYMVAGRVHELSQIRTLAALSSGLAATALLVVVTEMAVPALPVLGVAVLIAHPQARRPRPEERRAGFFALAAMSALGAFLLFR